MQYNYFLSSLVVAEDARLVKDGFDYDMSFRSGKGHAFGISPLSDEGHSSGPSSPP